MLHPRDPRNQETRIPRFKFKFNQNPHLILYLEILGIPSFWIWRIAGMQHFQNVMIILCKHAELSALELFELEPYTHTHTHTYTHKSLKAMSSESIHVCTMMHAYVPWLMHMCHDSYICAMTHSHVPWLIHMCHDSFICAMKHAHVPWLMYMRHDSCICAIHSYVPRLIICAMKHPHVPWLIHMYYDAFIFAMTCHREQQCRYEHLFSALPTRKS